MAAGPPSRAGSRSALARAASSCSSAPCCRGRPAWQRCPLARGRPAVPCAAPVPQDLRQYRRWVHQESLRQSVLPPEVAALKSSTAAIELRKEG